MTLEDFLLGAPRIHGDLEARVCNAVRSIVPPEKPPSSLAVLMSFQPSPAWLGVLPVDANPSMYLPRGPAAIDRQRMAGDERCRI
jgi:hypothetical protein